MIVIKSGRHRVGPEEADRVIWLVMGRSRWGPTSSDETKLETMELRVESEELIPG